MTAHVLTADPARSPPRIWLIIGDKSGDNAQALMVANSLGMPFETRRLRPKQRYESGKPRFEPGLAHFDSDRSDSLSAPWPDLVITIGRRHAMAALWVKIQHPQTRIVLLGRPRRWIERFDLVVTLPQYNVPDLPNVLQLQWPLMRPDETAIREQATHWQPVLDRLEKPLTAVFVGGPTAPYRFDKHVISSLVNRCESIRRELGGTLYYCTSRRTPPAITSRLESAAGTGSLVYHWNAESSSNPYQALLGTADHFVVTGDSISMLVEVAASSKPLAIFQLPEHRTGRLWQQLQRQLFGNQGYGIVNNGLRRLGHCLYRLGISGFGRDLGRVHHRLIAQGYAVPAGEPFKQPGQALPDETGQLRNRILGLVLPVAHTDRTPNIGKSR